MPGDPTPQQWAEEIASRIREEFTQDARFSAIDDEDRDLFEATLTEALVRCPDLAQKLVGTTIIDSHYFLELD